MAKTNTKSKAPSIHSRAARRATSPSINTDKSLKEVRPPPESVNSRPSVLGIHQNAGVTKKSKRGRKAVMSARARKRHEKVLERAEGIVDRTAVKVQKSKSSAAKIATRKRTWDEVNAYTAHAAADKANGGGNKFAELAGEDEDDGEVDGDLDDEMGNAEQITALADTAVAEDPSAAPAPAPAPRPQDEEDDIL